MRIEGIKKIGIIGLGKSGLAAAKLARRIGKEVKITEEKPSRDFSPQILKELSQLKTDIEFGGHSRKFLSDCGLIVTSPGISLNSPVIQLANSLNKPVAGEIEFASWFNKAKIVAITGTNGKSTASYLTYKFLSENIKKRKVALAGNIGTPFSEYVFDLGPEDIIVLEVSSFQLETIIEFKPYVGVILNIDSDHLDRHLNLENYLAAKKRIFQNQKENDWALINAGDPLLRPIADDLKAKVVLFGKEFSDENLSAVYHIGKIFGLDKVQFLKSTASFNGLPHRLQTVAKIKGVTFINDSKATNPSSTIWALKKIKQPVILICGGRDKNLDFKPVARFLKKVKKINLIGEASSKIKTAFSQKADMEEFSSLEKAVGNAFTCAQQGEVVLFSPMCASFDMFDNYAQRGDAFVKIVKAFK